MRQIKNRVPVPYRAAYRYTIITHAHCASLIDGRRAPGGLGHGATQRGPRPRLVATSHRLASYVIVSGLKAALDLDTYPLTNLIPPRCAERAKPGRGKPVLIMHIGFFACHLAISLERNRFSKIATLLFLLLVSLISRLVACSERIVVDTHTHRQT